MKRLALIFLWSGLAFFSAARAQDTVSPLFKQAQAAKTAGKFDDAIALYEKVLTEHPEASNRWYEAQMSITQSLVKKGDLAEAAKAAHLCLDGAPIQGAFDQSVMLAARILSAQDKSVDRANQLIAFAQAGPGSGQANPMAAVGYPALPAREAAFAAMRKQAGDDAAASHLRAMTFLFTGKPRDALAQFADAFRRSVNFGDPMFGGSDLVFVGLRAAQGHQAGLEEAMQFVIYGPDGPDGKAKTADDLADPFGGLLAAAPPAGEGGLAGLDAASVTALRQVQDAAQLYAGDSALGWELRKPALLALQRATTALDGWGAPGQRDWYFQELGLDDSSGRKDAVTFIHGAQLAARGRDLHYGGVRTLWNEIEAVYAAKSITPPGPLENFHAQFDKTCVSLGNVPSPKQELKPLTKPATF